MEEILALTIMGAVATGWMITYMCLISGLGASHVDMIRALGSIYSHDEKTGMLPGLLMQFTAGITMAYVYGIFLRIFDYAIAYKYALLSLGIGFVHGLIVTIVLAKLLAEHHPVPKYQHVGFKVALHHVVAHLVFGLVVGVMYAAFLI